MGAGLHGCGSKRILTSQRLPRRVHVARVRTRAEGRWAGGCIAMRRLVRIARVVIAAGLVRVWPVQGAEPNLIRNGSFEEGFTNGVANGWGSFSNGGHANYGWHADNWRPVVWDGQWSQLIEINTGGQEGVKPDRYAGIYQTVDVVPGTTYRLTLHGVVRSSEGSREASGWGYRLQWGIDYNGGSDWRALDPAAWKELDWYEWPRLAPGYYETLSTDVTATSSKMTLFIRAWKKWGTVNQEGDFNVDGISLVALAPAAADQPAQLPQTGAGLAAPLAGILLGSVALAFAG